MQPSVDVFGGVRVVELAQWVFVPVAGALMADWGAEVIKVEHPQGGDGYRGLVLPGAGSYPCPRVTLTEKCALHSVPRA